MCATDLSEGVDICALPANIIFFRTGRIAISASIFQKNSAATYRTRSVFSFAVANFQIGASIRAHQRRRKEEQEEQEEEEQECFFFRCKVPLVAFWFLLAMSADSCESKC
jgi:hypothetical protein